MDWPHAVLLDADVRDAQALAVDEFQKRRIAQARRLLDSAGDVHRGADQAGAGQGDLARALGPDEADLAGDPATLPPHLDDGRVGAVGRPLKDAVRLDSQGSVRADADTAEQAGLAGDDHSPPPGAAQRSSASWTAWVSLVTPPTCAPSSRGSLRRAVVSVGAGGSGSRRRLWRRPRDRRRGRRANGRSWVAPAHPCRFAGRTAAPGVGAVTAC